MSLLVLSAMYLSHQSIIHRATSSLWPEVVLEKETLELGVNHGYDVTWSRRGWRRYSTQKNWHQLRCRHKRHEACLGKSKQISFN